MQKQRTKGFNPSDLVNTMLRHRVHRAEESALIEDFFIALDTPVSLSCYLLYKYHEFDQLVSKDIDPLFYNKGVDFQSDFAAISFLRKNESLRTTFQKKALAISAFNQAEIECDNTNVRLENPDSSCFLVQEDVAIIKVMRRKIYGILKSFDIDEVLDLSTWGPGSTTKISGSDTGAPRKFEEDLQISRDAHSLYFDILSRAYPTWLGTSEPDLVVGNKIITVPKNAKIERTIAIEPGLNSWIQLGIGKHIRKRLRFAGYDLNSNLNNRTIAQNSSRDGLAATIDFKAASDTISISAVKLLLPERWFSCLDSARSHYYTLSGETKRFSKFSTMGNGFTFELESLIFLSMALAISEANGLDQSLVSIFGDDLTLSVDGVTQLRRICTYLGFTINERKSFSSGVFRESCGSYYFDGLDVKPIFLKKGIIYIKDLYKFANAVTLLSMRFSFLGNRDRRFKRLWNQTVSFVPPSLRVYGPMSSGDSTIHSSLSECKLARYAKNSIEGFYFQGFPSVAINVSNDSHGMLLARLFRPSIDEFNNNSSLRAKVKIVFKKNMFTKQWCDPGKWI